MALANFLYGVFCVPFSTICQHLLKSNRRKVHAPARVRIFKTPTKKKQPLKTLFQIVLKQFEKQTKNNSKMGLVLKF